MKTISNRVMRSALVVSAILAFTISSAGARSVPDPVSVKQSPADTSIQVRTHDANRVRLPFTNVGSLANPAGSGPLLWNGDSYLSVGGLWIGARTDEEYPEIYGSSTYIPYTTDYSDFTPSPGPAGGFRESGEGVAGGGRRGLSDNGDDDRDGVTDEDPLNGVDDDADGRIDEDYTAAGVQMFTTEYRDDQVEESDCLRFGSCPLGVRVRQRSIAWNGVKTSDFIGIEYEITNVGDQRLRDVYLGLHLDADVGPPDAPQYWTDDLAGFARIDVPGPDSRTGCAGRTALDLIYAWDFPDTRTPDGGDTPGYVGAVFLGYEADANVLGGNNYYPPHEVPVLPPSGRMSAAAWGTGRGFPEGLDPRNNYERYNFMASGRFPMRNAISPDDYRLYASTGPFARFHPGDHITLSIAIVLGNGYEELVANAIAAKRAYDGVFIDEDQDPSTGVEGRETCVTAPDPPETVHWDDPCDSAVTYIVPEFDPCFWVDRDCDPCTGRGGREAPLHWVESLPPLVPASNVDPDFSLTPPGVEIYAVPAAGDARVTLQWDNAAEIQPDPVSGRNIFEGYRIWRADAYAGGGDETPAESEWEMVAEFRLNPEPDSILRCDHCRPFDPILRRDRDEVRRMTPYGPYYLIGRYQWSDTLDIVNGKVYFYAVTPFGITTRVYTDHTEEVEIATSPVFAAHRVIVPHWAAGSGCASVKVVPNPYHGDAEWDLTPSDCDPSGRKIAFRSLPEGWTSLHIYTLAGDLVLSAGPEDSRVVGGCETSGTTNPGGTFFWDLIGDAGRQVTSGVYLYTMESPGERCKGRFVIIR